MNDMSDFIKNKKISLNFKILEEYTAGIELLGFEVKSIKAKKGSLEGTHITVRGGEAYLIGSFIPPYQTNNTPKSYDPHRNRKLLLTKKELHDLKAFESHKGLTIVPMSMYNKSNLIKVRIAVAQGKKKFDKREDIKKKDMSRDIERQLKTKIQ